MRVSFANSSDFQEPTETEGKRVREFGKSAILEMPPCHPGIGRSPTMSPNAPDVADKEPVRKWFGCVFCTRGAFGVCLLR